MSINRLARTFGNAMLIGAGLLSACLISEWVIRLVYTVPSNKMDFFSLRSSPYYYAHERLGWLPRANIHGVHEQQGSFATTFRTNSRGLRDKEYSLAKSDGILRVIVLGDSFTWGWGVNDDEIYTEVVESVLDHTEVINLGVTGFNTRQEFEYLKLEGMLYRPDLVVLGLCMNDISEVSMPTPSVRVSDANNRLPIEESVFLRAKQFLGTHSVVYRFVIDRVNTNKNLANLLAKIGLKGELAGFEGLDVNLRPALRVYPSSLQQQWIDLTSFLLELRTFLQERNVRFIVLLIPSLQSVDKKAFKDTISYTKYNPEDFDLDKPYRLLEEFARSNRIELVNPLSAFRDQYAHQETLFLNRDMHFNAAGHKVFASAVAKGIASAKAAD